MKIDFPLKNKRLEELVIKEFEERIEKEQRDIKIKLCFVVTFALFLIFSAFYTLLILLT